MMSRAPKSTPSFARSRGRSLSPSLFIPRASGHGVGLVAAFVGWALCTTLGVAQTPSLTLLGIPPGRVHSYSTVLSADGRVVAGYARLPDSQGGGSQGFSWTAAGGMDVWGASPGVPVNTRVNAITADGSAIFGSAQPRPMTAPNDGEAFRYSNGTYESLGSIPGFNQASIFGVSGDGSVGVGGVQSTDTPSRCMRWTPTGGMQNIGLPRANDRGGWFTGISRDGNVAIARSISSTSGGYDGFTWTQSGGWRQLPVPSGVTGGYDLVPVSTNFDGSIQVGWVGPFNTFTKAVRWQDGVATELGAFGSRWHMAAACMSDNGRLIAGSGRDPLLGTDQATIWLDSGAPIRLVDYLATIGVSVPAGYRLEWCSGVSADGLTITGGANLRGAYEPFVVTLPAPGVALLMSAFGAWVCVGRKRTQCIARR